MYIAAMRKSEGITLIEMLIAMSVVLVGVAASYTLLGGIQATQAGNMRLVQAQQEARNIVEHIARELRESSVDYIWIDSTSGKADSIIFHVPRDGDRAFHVYHEVNEEGIPLSGYGRPVPQSTIAYSLDSSSHYLYRYRLSGLISDIDKIKWDSDGEIISRRVEKILFGREDNMITISVRTFEEPNSKLANATKSYSDYYTKIEFRN